MTGVRWSAVMLLAAGACVGPAASRSSTMATLAPTDSITARQMRQARLLYPTRMDADSTYAYVFIVDPVVTSRSYSFPDLFTRAYGGQKSTEYMQLFRESLARASDTYVVTNTSW